MEYHGCRDASPAVPSWASASLPKSRRRFLVMKAESISQTHHFARSSLESSFSSTRIVKTNIHKATRLHRVGIARDSNLVHLTDFGEGALRKCTETCTEYLEHLLSGILRDFSHENFVKAGYNNDNYRRYLIIVEH